MIRIQMIRGNTCDPDRRKRHPSRASCEAGGRRYEATGPAPNYRLMTLLWLHGHGGERFEVWDDRDPFGKPGGLALRGQVRNWVRIVKGKPVFNKDASSEMDFSPHERKMVEQAAGRVARLIETDSVRPENAHTARSHPPDGPEHLQEQDDASAAFAPTPRPEAA